MSGNVGDLSQNQKDILEQFKNTVKDILKPEHDDYYVLRWLRARSFDLKKSETMIRNDYAWRKQIGADTIREDFKLPEVLQKYYIGGFCGYDNEGCPVWYEPFGHIDLKGVLRSVKKMEIMKMKVQQMEKIYHYFRTAEEKGHKVPAQIIIVFDLDKFSMKHLWKPGVDVMCDLITMFEDHYPETLKSSYIINAPRIFPIAYNLFRPFLSEGTVMKVQILGSNYKEVLARNIPPQELPIYYGGSKNDPDPRCTNQICFGGEVPESYYVQQITDLSGFTESTIGRGSSLQVDYEIKVKNSAIRWQFKTDGFDIGFGVYRRTKDGRQKAGDMEAVMATTRVNSHLVPEDGSLTCRETGTYVVRFDNTYSWTRGKKIFYQIEVLEPDVTDLQMPRSPSQDSNNTFFDTVSS
ncbi:SEC14-like protein 2 [Haliotis rubra]|uniref:SEC14-like protein 2 n=1 Tax=Haliotis rubra TaxID=36100 RepID=UPI001EE5AFCE|nr:SEC14-like protein 2 [Haliotis rubra]